MPNRRQTWPYNGAAASPPALTQSPDGLWNSDRSFVGPLRMGTAPGVGPRRAVVAEGATDMGLDNITPRGIDPIGTSDLRGPAQPSSALINRYRRR